MRDFLENKREDVVIDLGFITDSEIDELDDKYSQLTRKVLHFSPRPDYRLIKFDDNHVELHCENGFCGLLRFA